MSNGVYVCGRCGSVGDSCQPHECAAESGVRKESRDQAFAMVESVLRQAGVERVHLNSDGHGEVSLVDDRGEFVVGKARNLLSAVEELWRQ